jgi:hypothetical protein
MSRAIFGIVLYAILFCFNFAYAENNISNQNGANFVLNNFDKIGVSENEIQIVQEVQNLDIYWGKRVNTLSQKQNIDIEEIGNIDVGGINIASTVLDIENTSNKIKIFNTFSNGNAIQKLTNLGQDIAQNLDEYKQYEVQLQAQILEINQIKDSNSIVDIAVKNFKNLADSLEAGVSIAKVAYSKIPVIKATDLVLNAGGKIEDAFSAINEANNFKEVVEKTAENFNTIINMVTLGEEPTMAELRNLISNANELYLQSEALENISDIGDKLEKINTIISTTQHIIGKLDKDSDIVRLQNALSNSKSNISNSQDIVEVALKYKKSELHKDFLSLALSVTALFDINDSVGDISEAIDNVDTSFRNSARRARESSLKNKKERIDKINTAIDGLLLTSQKLTNEVYEDIGTEVKNNPERLNFIISNRHQIPIIPPIDQDNSNINKEIGDNEDRDEAIGNANSPNTPLDKQYSYITTGGDYGYNSVETVNSYSVQNEDTLTDVIGSGAVQLKLNVQTATGDKVLDTITTTPTTNDGTRQFQYVGWGEYIGTGKTFVAPWDSQTKTVQHGYYTIGVPTNHYPDGGSYPKSATYNGSIQGDYANNTSGNIAGAVSGTITLNADFTNNSIGGQMNVNVNNTPWETTTFNNINFSQQDNSFNGSMTITGGGTGQIAGGFNGQNAEESAGGFFINKNNGEGVSGIYRAKR